MMIDDMNAIFRWYFAPMFECPCKREGKGCPNYYVQENRPYYICRITNGEAHVPTQENIGDWSTL